MFTGLIREFGEVVDFKNNVLIIKANHKPKVGDSIAINGACLTVVEIDYPTFSVEIGSESKNILALENYKTKVHIEPAMKLSDRVEGHIIQGHIDCIGVIKNIKKTQNSTDITIAIDKEFIKFVVPKGSIAIDGVSLTVNDVFEESFRITIIPHTIKNTLFEDYSLNKRVNIETDMFARYVYHIFKHDKKELSWSDIDRISFSY
ncbi:MAG: riboflavin synthase [Campylobacterales bacterium]|nr:riboflavin synthase [Campylobacterales bacterium]